jgi:hypothetical protein
MKGAPETSRTKRWSPPAFIGFENGGAARDEMSGNLDARIAAYYGLVSEGEGGRGAREEERNPDTWTEPAGDAEGRAGSEEWLIKIIAQDRWAPGSRIRPGSGVRRLFQFIARVFRRQKISTETRWHGHEEGATSREIARG